MKFTHSEGILMPSVLHLKPKKLLNHFYVIWCRTYQLILKCVRFLIRSSAYAFPTAWNRTL